MEKEKNHLVDKKRGRKRRWFFYLLLFVILFPIVIFLLLQFNAVQNYTVDLISKRISNSIDGSVLIDEVDVSIKHGLELEGFRLLGEDGDSILVAQSLNIGLKESLFSLINNRISIDKIELENPTVNIRRELDEKKDNLTLIINSLFPPKKDNKNGKPLNLDIKEIEIKELALSIFDENSLQKQEIYVTRGYIEIESFLKENYFNIKTLELENPVIRLSKEKGESTLISEIENVDKSIEAVVDDTTQLHLVLQSLKISEGIFSFNDYNKTIHSENDILDFSHFEFSDIDLNIADFDFSENSIFSFDLNQFDFIDNKGFRVKKLACENVKIDNSQIDFPNFEFITDKTVLKESLHFGFKNFSDLGQFEDKVNLEAEFTNSRVYFGDLLHFIRSLNSKEFFIKNKNRTVELAGHVKGTVDQLVGDNMKVKMGDDFILNANFSTRNLTEKDREMFNISIGNLDTDMDFLKSFIPGFKPPENFYKLGLINFNGRFDGYLKDFVAFGSLNTAIGNAFLDMRLDTKDGTSFAQYSGDISMENFNLGYWSDNEDFGKVDFTGKISDGRGLTLNSLYSDLYALVEQIEFKGYKYKDIEMDAQIDKNNFNGEFKIKDDNIDIVFEGNMELKDEIPYLDFEADIGKLDLQKLNLSKNPFSAQGNIDLNLFGKNIDDVVGMLTASNLSVIANDTIYDLDTLSIEAFEPQNENRHIHILSDIGDIDIEGQYHIQEIVGSVKNILKENYPHYTQNWEVEKQNNSKVQNVRFDLDIVDSENFLELVGLKDFRTKNLKAKGSLNSVKGDLSFASTVPFLKIKNNSFFDSQILISSTSHSGDLLVNVDSTVIGNNSFNPIDFQSRMTGDTVNFLVSSKEIADSLKSIDVQGRLVPHEQGYKVNITDNKIEALGGIWEFDRANEIIIGKDFHDIHNLTMSDGKRAITIDDVNQKGVSVFLTDFNFSMLNDPINYDKMKFRGEGDLQLKVENVYKIEDLSANMFVQDFFINEDSYGTLDINVNRSGRKPINAAVSLGNTSQGLVVDGTVDPDNDYFIDAKVKANNFSLKIFEYLLIDGIKNTYGGVDVVGTVKGSLPNLDIDGNGLINGGTSIVYTGVDYKFENQKVSVDETKVDLTGVHIIDPEGGAGLITGGLKHDVFTDFSLDAVITGSNVVALNTTKYNNPQYYGYGKGDVRASFTGPFHLVNIKIDCTTRDGTVLNIPISEGEASTDKSFIEFVRREELFQKEQDLDEDFRFEGVDIELDVTMTQDARTNIIFDESRGDIIQGHGRGNLKINVTRYGDFDMYGNYEIDRGEYLFTALGAVAKPFKVRRGGSITWTGDPVNATLNMKADYSVRTAMNIFLAEFVNNIPGIDEASKSSTKVDLILNLGGTLYKPKVNFDLAFPALEGELRTTAESKMRTLRSNQAELNSQVLGLIVFKSFLPSSGTLNLDISSDIGNTGIGTLSEFVSSQLSLLFTGLLNEALADNGLISGIDFDIGMRKTSIYGSEPANSDILPDEIEVHLKNRFKFLNERLSLDLGGNYVRENVLIGGDYFIGDFVLEYFLTDNKKLKLRMYGRYDYDEFYRERRQKYGVGIGYRTEFGTLSDFKQTMAQQFRDQIGPDESQD